MINATFLADEQIYGRKKLSIFDIIDPRAAMSDYGITCGGYVSDNYHTSDGNTLETRTGWYWTRTDDGDNDARAVGRNGLSY